MITLVAVYGPDGEPDVGAVGILYELLRERPVESRISHKTMPTVREHTDFVKKHPYLAWYIVADDGEPVGSIYLTKAREIGIFIFKDKQRQGHARAAIRELARHHPGRLLANVAPANDPSHKLFQGLGARVIQVTYEL